MRALQVQRLDGPDGIALVDLPEPEAGTGVRIDVVAAGVSFPDLLLSRGLYQLKPDPPFVPGVEVAGVVRDVPDGSRFAPGDRVMAFTFGGFADTVAVPEEMVFPMPGALSFEQAGGFIMNHHTARFALHRRGRLADGETVLVHGAAGGVGTAAVQVAKGAGARVLAVVSTEEKGVTAREAGADDVMLSTDDWVAGVRDATGGRGADVIVDPVGGERFSSSLRCLAPEGRILVVGFTSGEIPEVAVNRLLLRNVDVVGVAWGAFLGVDPAIGRAIADELEQLVEAGEVRPVVGRTYPLEEGPQALRDLESRTAVGKLVLRMRDL